MSDGAPAPLDVAFLGLGVMGFPMAGHLARNGHRVTVFNRTPKRAQEWIAKHGGRSAETAAAAAKGAAIVFTCVGNDNDVRSIVFGEHGAVAGMKPGAALVDHTTASAKLARECDETLKAAGLQYLDAPVSGGQAGAENGALTIMVGGSERTFDHVAPVMQCYGRAVTRMGPAGYGQLTKMVNQICIAGLLEGLAEGLNFAVRAGLDAKRVVDVISKGAAQSWQMENRGKTMIDEKFDFGFAVDWMRKDLGICLDEARSNGALLPATALVDQFYAELQLRGAGRLDTSSLMKRLRDVS